MARNVKITDEATISAVYAALDLKAPEDRALARITVILEPGKPIRLTEDTVLFFDTPEPEKSATETAPNAPIEEVAKTEE